MQTPEAKIKALIFREFAKIQAANPGFSLRSLARRVAVSPATLSNIQSGKSRLTRKVAEKALVALGLMSVETARWVDTLNSRAPSRAAALDFEELDFDRIRMVSDWYYFAILSLLETEGAQGEVAWIAKRLALPLRTVRAALRTLADAGMLKKTEKGYAATGRAFRTTTQVDNAYIRLAHLRDLERIRLALETVPQDARDSTAITIATNPGKIREAKARLQKFRRELMEFLESGEKNEVYRLSLHLYPLTQVGE